MTIPAASGASVGIAGLTLGGGFGVVSRKYGLACDNVIGVELVDASGELVYANAEQNPDLFWACRGGGGGNFGIVTAFDFKLNPIGMVAVCNITWRWADFMAVVGTFVQWAPNAPDSLSTFLRLGVGSVAGDAGDSVITLFGQLTPDSPADLAGFSTLLAPMLAAAPPTGISVQMMPYAYAAAAFAGVDPEDSRVDAPSAQRPPTLQEHVGGRVRAVPDQRARAAQVAARKRTAAIRLGDQRAEHGAVAGGRRRALADADRRDGGPAPERRVRDAVRCLLDRPRPTPRR